MRATRQKQTHSVPLQRVGFRRVQPSRQAICKKGGGCDDNVINETVRQVIFEPMLKGFVIYPVLQMGVPAVKCAANRVRRENVICDINQN